MNAQQVIDSIESDLARIRNLDAALLASLIARLDQLRGIYAGNGSEAAGSGLLRS